MAQTLKYHTKVKRGGKVELQKVPMKAGTPIEVILIEKNGNFKDLLNASTSSADFWDNPIDDETWNDA
ncbi:MAG: hypothetical protein HY707_02200 [Ignavibacteriae bacterium]|nr:hypothetical protein [Ignavibacteriota bacterium]